MIAKLIRTARRLAAVSLRRGQIRPLPDAAEQELTTDAGGNDLVLERDQIEARIHNLVLFLRERPCGSNGLGSMDRCGLPHRASRCGVHATLEQLGADVASILDQLDQLRGRVDAAGDAPEGELWDTNAGLGEVLLDDEFVISEAMKLTQKIQLRG